MLNLKSEQLKCFFVAVFILKSKCILKHAGSTEAAGAACSSWTTLYSHKEQITLAPGNLLTILPVRPKEWQVKFELQPTSFDYDIECGMCNILHMTNFCHRGSQLGCVGSQIPRFYYDPRKDMKLTMVTASNGDGSDYGGSYKMSSPVIGAWTTIEMSQELTDGRYMIKQSVDGRLVHSWENTQPQSFENVSVYASTIYKSQIIQPGFIRGLLIQGKGDFFE